MRQREDWILQAVTALRAGGIDAVRVEPLARALGVTKGSFYWHFSDRSELLEELLRRWERETSDLVAGASTAPTAAERLRRFFELVVVGSGNPPDTAIFAWAEHDAAVARRAEATEGRRIEFLRRQLRAQGLGEEEAARRADALYLATLGWLQRASRVLSMEQDLLSVVDVVAGQLAAPAA